MAGRFIKIQLAIDIFRTHRNLDPSFMTEIFVAKDSLYTVRSGSNALALLGKRSCFVKEDLFVIIIIIILFKVGNLHS